MILPTISSRCHLNLAVIFVSSYIIDTYRAITPVISFLISGSPDIIALWYHNFHDNVSLIMAPAWRNGAPCARRCTSSGLTIANVLGTVRYRLVSWMAAVLIQRMDLLVCERLPRGSRWKHEKLTDTQRYQTRMTLELPRLVLSSTWNWVSKLQPEWSASEGDG